MYIYKGFCYHIVSKNWFSLQIYEVKTLRKSVIIEYVQEENH